MSAKPQTPYARLIALSAILLAAGLLSLRAYDVFGKSASEPVGSAAERQLTYLLEPIAGPDKVRVSISGRSEQTILVMIDGDPVADTAALRAQIEPVLRGSLNFDPESDTLTLSQFPFARGIGGTLTAMEVAELTGLGLLCLLLFGNLIGIKAPSLTTPATAPQRPTPQVQPPRPMAPITPDTPEWTKAAKLAESNPNQTAHLVRTWLKQVDE